MRPHDRLDSRARELAALHALDALPAQEAADYEAHLAGCSLCFHEVASLREAAADLVLLSPSVQPPAGLKDRLIEKVRSGSESRADLSAGPEWRVPRPAGPRPQAPGMSSADTPGGAPLLLSRPGARGVETPAAVQPWQKWAGERPAGGHSLTRATEAEWEPTGFEGVESRRLSVDASKDRVTMLVRMAAGSAYPPHVHRGPEECYVIEGDLKTGSVVMGPGDFKFSDVDSEDDCQSTTGGCLLLIVSSMKDELLHGRAAD